MEARMFLQPRSHGGMLVRGAVVADQMQFLFLRRFPINLTQEIEPLGMAVPLRTARDDGAVERAHCRKQRGRALPLAIVGHRRGFPLFQRQPRLRAIQRLHLTFFVSARQQNDARTPGYPRIDRLRSHATFQFTALFIAQLDRRGLIHHSLRSRSDVMATRREYSSMISKALH